MKQLIVIQGPTASGKTSLAIALAKHYNTVVLSADSRQFYKEIAIGTAKPSKEEQAGIKNYFIDSHRLTEEVNAAKFAEEANQVLKEEFKKHDKIILVGGSGLFIKALCEGLDEIPHDAQINQKWEKIYQEKGIAYLQNQLQTKDLTYFNEVDIQNARRLIRALEVIELTGKKYSDLRQNEHQIKEFRPIYFTIQMPREKLYENINLRVDHMLRQGLENEVKAVIHLKHLKSLNTVGYQELFAYFEGKTTKQEAIDLIKQNSRRYAKRQITWFKKNQAAFIINEQELEERVKFVLERV